MELIIRDIKFYYNKKIQDLTLVSEDEVKKVLELEGYTVLKSVNNFDKIKEALIKTGTAIHSYKIIPKLTNLDKQIFLLGCPDLFVFRIWDKEKIKPYYFWVEVKTPGCGLSESQMRWIERWKPHILKIIYVHKVKTR